VLAGADALLRAGSAGGVGTTGAGAATSAAVADPAVEANFEVDASESRRFAEQLPFVLVAYVTHWASTFRNDRR
jgi:hypothetical protein